MLLEEIRVQGFFESLAPRQFFQLRQKRGA